MKILFSCTSTAQFMNWAIFFLPSSCTGQTYYTVHELGIRGARFMNWAISQIGRNIYMANEITWTKWGLYTLSVRVIKYFLDWGFCLLWFLSFVLLSHEAFVNLGFYLPPPPPPPRPLPSTWSHEQNRNCPHLYHMNRKGIVHRQC